MCRVLEVSTSGYYAWRQRVSRRRCVRFCLSFRDVEDILAERGVIVTCGVPLTKTVMPLTSWSSVDETRALQGDSSGSC